MAAFAGLTEGERERLEMLIEEAAEVVQAATKVLRHGYSSYNPNLPEETRGTNRSDLIREFNDLLAIAGEMDRCGDIFIDNGYGELDRIFRKKLQYTHHQGDGK
ncbi:MAG TPA: hypothetical protein VF944_04470 [Candidatus Bathyarchaeia archaeon]